MRQLFLHLTCIKSGRLSQYPLLAHKGQPCLVSTHSSAESSFFSTSVNKKKTLAKKSLRDVVLTESSRQNERHASLTCVTRVTAELAVRQHEVATRLTETFLGPERTRSGCVLAVWIYVCLCVFHCVIMIRKKKLPLLAKLMMLMIMMMMMMTMMMINFYFSNNTILSGSKS